ncbi:MAG TPA: phosphatidylglycerophosphatase A [Pyrinomonadaceae bacterium]|jgi:phosphatidylglycerophosphatase A
MVIKESSDELNPTELTTTFVKPAPRTRSALDYLALALATCGVGFIPVAPGTLGSLLAVGIYLLFNLAYARLLPFPALTERNVSNVETVLSLMRNTMQAAGLRTLVLLLFVTLLSWAGIWAATRTESLLRRKDPGAVVIDEVVGQLITFLFLPFGVGLWTIFAGFLAFRLFDIWKPYPIRRLEALESGLGIMADDVLAGIYAAIFVALLWTTSLML